MFPSLPIRTALLVCSVTVCEFGYVDAIAGGVRAGTLIENSTIATYDDGGASRTITSNPVVVRVAELFDVTVTSFDYGLPKSRMPMSKAIFAYRVYSKGMTAEHQLGMSPIKLNK